MMDPLSDSGFAAAVPAAQDLLRGARTVQFRLRALVRSAKPGPVEARACGV